MTINGLKLKAKKMLNEWEIWDITDMERIGRVYPAGFFPVPGCYLSEDELHEIGILMKHIRVYDKRASSSNG